ncbi:MAG TPA: hypothetical protein VMT15_08670 [Bryobacteraceae bacterium]|nr:hypothetical protein [Bryobacteraceae bacterium]
MRRLLIWAMLGAPALTAGDAYVRSALAKLHRIEDGKVKPGSVVFFSLQEINSWALYMVPQIVPEGIRDQRVTLGTDVGTAYALMDFLKMRHAQGKATGWIMERLIEGERPVTISIRLQSGGGRCLVNLTRVEISGVSATGSVLDFLIKTFFMPLYPTAHINEAFEIGYNIDRIELRPSGVRVTMKK